MKVKEQSEKTGLKLNIQKTNIMVSSPCHCKSKLFMANRWGNNGKSERLFWGAAKSLQMVTAAMKFKDTCFLEEKL